MITESRKVTIVVKRSLAELARVGEGVDPSEVIRKHERIGASLRGSDVNRGLTLEEETMLLPNVINIDPKSEHWVRATRDYWANISRDVPIDFNDDTYGLDLQVGFIYDNAEDAAKGNNEESAEFTKYVNARNQGREYVMQFYARMKLGRPINVEDFILYRYCLVYSHVANRPEDVNVSNKIRFYILSEQQVKAEAKEKHEQVVRSMATYLELIGDRTKVDDVIDILQDELSRFAASKGKKTTFDTDVDKDSILLEYSNAYSGRFMNVANDKQLARKAFIERAITNGILRRLPNTDIIMYGDNTKLGDNIVEAVDFLKLDKNKTIYQEIEARLKVLK